MYGSSFRSPPGWQSAYLSSVKENTSHKGVFHIHLHSIALLHIETMLKWLSSFLEEMAHDLECYVIVGIKLSQC